MAVALDISVPFETIVAVRNAADMDKAVNALTKGTGADRVIAVCARAVVEAINDLPFEITAKNPVTGSQLSGSKPVFTPSESASSSIKSEETSRVIAVFFRDVDGKRDRFFFREDATWKTVAEQYALRKNVWKSDLVFTWMGETYVEGDDISLSVLGIDAGSTVNVSTLDSRGGFFKTGTARGSCAMSDDGADATNGGCWQSWDCAWYEPQVPANKDRPSPKEHLDTETSITIRIRDLMGSVHTIVTSPHATCFSILKTYSARAHKSAESIILKFPNGTSFTGEHLPHRSIGDFGIKDGSLVLAYPNPDHEEVVDCFF